MIPMSLRRLPISLEKKMRNEWRELSEHSFLPGYKISLQDGKLMYKVAEETDRDITPTISGGEVHISMRSLAIYLLDQGNKAEIIEGLLQDDDARASILDCLRSRYADGMTDDDRRRFLAAVGEQVVHERIDRIAQHILRLSDNWKISNDASNKLREANRVLEQNNVRMYPGGPIYHFKIPENNRSIKRILDVLAFGRRRLKEYLDGIV